MATISQAQARAYAARAGFSGTALNIMVAIATAESSLNTTAQGRNGDGSLDRGIAQINSRAHPEVSDACAYDPGCAFKAAYSISSRGTNFTPWTTYTSGAYLRYLAGGSSPTSPAPGGQPWYSYPINQLNDYATTYKGPGTDTPHYAVDIEAPMDTPFFFLEPGKIVKADYAPWGGEVYEQPDQAGAPQEYVYHLDMVNVQVGQHVNAGQVIGLSGGQTSGGHHPTSPQYSTGPHIHFGEFTKFVNSPNGTIPYGPDPNPLINQAKEGFIPLPSGSTDTSTTTTDTSSTTTTDHTPVPLSQKVNDTLSNLPGFAGLAVVLDEVEQFPGIVWYNPSSTVQIVPGGALGDVINGAASAVFDPSDYIGAGIRSVLDTIWSNTVPFLVRSLIVGVGLLLIGGLVWNAVQSSGMIEDSTSIAKMAAVAA